MFQYAIVFDVGVLQSVVAEQLELLAHEGFSYIESKPCVYAKSDDPEDSDFFVVPLDFVQQQYLNDESRCVPVELSYKNLTRTNFVKTSRGITCFGDLQLGIN